MTSLIDITDLTDTIGDVGTLLSNIADIIPDITDLSVKGQEPYWVESGGNSNNAIYSGYIRRYPRICHWCT